MVEDASSGGHQRPLSRRLPEDVISLRPRPDHAVLVVDVVRDGDDVEAGLAVDVHYVPERNGPVRPGGVNMEIAKKHGR